MNISSTVRFSKCIKRGTFRLFFFSNNQINHASPPHIGCSGICLLRSIIPFRVEWSFSYSSERCASARPSRYISSSRRWTSSRAPHIHWDSTFQWWRTSFCGVTTRWYSWALPSFEYPRISRCMWISFFLRFLWLKKITSSIFRITVSLMWIRLSLPCRRVSLYILLSASFATVLLIFIQDSILLRKLLFSWHITHFWWTETPWLVCWVSEANQYWLALILLPRPSSVVLTSTIPLKVRYSRSGLITNTQNWIF